eukprot:2315799-Karenia_brevis.AAC.1
MPVGASADPGSVHPASGPATVPGMSLALVGRSDELGLPATVPWDAAIAEDSRSLCKGFNSQEHANTRACSFVNHAMPALFDAIQAEDVRLQDFNSHELSSIDGHASPVFFESAAGCMLSHERTAHHDRDPGPGPGP